MTVAQVITEVAQGLVGAITTLGGGIASGVKDFITALLFETTGEGSSATTQLSSFMTIVILAGAVALAVGITRKIFGMVRSVA